MRFVSESFRKNAVCEAVLAAGRADETGQMYLNGTDAKDPRVSPLFANFKGAPPVWITVGDTEILLDDGRGMARALDDVGVDVTFVEERDLPHVWPIFHNILTEARQTLDDLADWIRQVLARQGES